MKVKTLIGSSEMLQLEVAWGASEFIISFFADGKVMTDTEPSIHTNDDTEVIEGLAALYDIANDHFGPDWGHSAMIPHEQAGKIDWLRNAHKIR